MSSILYMLTSSVSRVCESEDVECYGISCFEDGKEIVRYEDVLLDKEEMIKFVDTCNSLELSPEQLPDALEDLLP